MQKHGHKSTISKHHQVGRHWAVLWALLRSIHCSYECTKMQTPSISQGLYPILLLALSASMTSAYTSLGVFQDLNPQPQLFKASVYHSARSVVTKVCFLKDLRTLLLCTFFLYLIDLQPHSHKCFLKILGAFCASRN